MIYDLSVSSTMIRYKQGSLVPRISKLPDFPILDVVLRSWEELGDEPQHKLAWGGGGGGGWTFQLVLE